MTIPPPPPPLLQILAFQATTVHTLGSPTHCHISFGPSPCAFMFHYLCIFLWPLISLSLLLLLLFSRNKPQEARWVLMAVLHLNPIQYCSSVHRINVHFAFLSHLRHVATDLLWPSWLWQDPTFRQDFCVRSERPGPWQGVLIIQGHGDFCSLYVAVVSVAAAVTDATMTR